MSERNGFTPGHYPCERNSLTAKNRADVQSLISIPEFDVKNFQKKYDEERVKAMAQGLLMLFDQSANESFPATEYYAISRGQWITQTEAQQETGLEPMQLDKVVSMEEFSSRKAA